VLSGLNPCLRDRAKITSHLGISALITSVFAAMKEATEMLEEAELRDQFKLMVGGGIANTMVKEYINADFQTIDAMEGVAYCMKSIGGK